MYLKRVEIVGFRGINQLVLDIDPNQMMLTGENTWGKSSLLGALSLLSPEQLDYPFTARDFYQPTPDQPAPAEQALPSQRATLSFTFAEKQSGQWQSPIYQLFEPVAEVAEEGLKQLTYQILATRTSANDIVMAYHFLDRQGQVMATDAQLAERRQYLVRLSPVMRLKNPLQHEMKGVSPEILSDHYLELLSHQLKAAQTSLSGDDVFKGLQVARALMSYYLVDSHQRDKLKRQAPLGYQPSLTDWNVLDRFNHALDGLEDEYTRLSLLAVFTGLLCSEEGQAWSAAAMPILLLEEPESQLHPIILSVAMHLLGHLPVQKIITTNSSDTLALAELMQIYRLKRYPDYIEAKHVNEKSLGHSDVRRIKFHILYRRSAALFARTWLLVEGETEVWILRELAEQAGYYLNSEGVQIIEFAQCGLKPLIKYAQQMGIHWHVLTDGDQAGKKYADTVRSLCPQERQLDDYLTVLPAKDMENFMFRHGFSHIYKMMACGTTAHIDMPISRIIQKAIHKSSKPDLAVAICDDARARGLQAIPNLFKQMFARIVKSS
ncbi:DUF2813 domain-containing protein [Utexia brackfieldae]|uniref:DUF2813 domain-containing protein n=1 Tax=Utexia brackfieldae TaxID=3074108 RepID=UPI00370DD4EC